MAVSFELPRDLEKSLREQLANLDQAAKEALLLELYRQGKVTEHQVGKALGLSRYETDGLLKQHQIFHDLTAEDVARESDGLRQLREGNGQHLRWTPEQRAAAWDTWVASMRDWGTKHLPPGHVVNDSRESIYEGRGE